MDPLHEENSDRSYKFSHVSEPVDGSILRQEESDADGNIKGISNYLVTLFHVGYFLDHFMQGKSFHKRVHINPFL